MNSTEHQPLDYASPPPRLRRYWAGPVAMWSLVVIVWLAAGLFIVPRFEPIFKAFKIRLPFITQILLSWSHWMNTGFGWLQILPLPIVFAFLTPRIPEDRPRSRGGTRILVLSAILTLALTLLLIFTALIMPLLSLLTAVSGK